MHTGDWKAMGVLAENELAFSPLSPSHSQSILLKCLEFMITLKEIT